MLVNICRFVKINERKWLKNNENENIMILYDVVMIRKKLYNLYSLRRYSEMISALGEMKMHDIENASAEELTQIKTWLFKENIRIENERELLEQQMQEFDQEKNAMMRSIREQGSKNEFESKQLEREKVLFHHKWEILESAYRDLHEEKKKFEVEKQQLIGRRNQSVSADYGNVSIAGIFFRGVNNPLALKKRYKDLIKIFHPDNMAGDNDTVQLINREYSSLRDAYQM